MPDRNYVSGREARDTTKEKHVGCSWLHFIMPPTHKSSFPESSSSWHILKHVEQFFCGKICWRFNFFYGGEIWLKDQLSFTCPIYLHKNLHASSATTTLLGRLKLRTSSRKPSQILICKHYRNSSKQETVLTLSVRATLLGRFTQCAWSSSTNVMKYCLGKRSMLYIVALCMMVLLQFSQTLDP